jgi:hypothetical protein
VRVITTGPHGLERHAAFVIGEHTPEITRRVRENLADEF